MLLTMFGYTRLTQEGFNTLEKNVTLMIFNKNEDYVALF